MRNWKIGALALSAAGVCLLLAGCGTVDEDLLNMQANYAVDISVPYATATPLPDALNVPDPIIIDANGNVILNDTSIIEGDFQSARQQEEQTEYRSLSLGNTGIAVQALQQRLRELGYFSGEISGLYDADTEAAVKRFEQTYGTMQTGVATAKLQLKLFAASAPSYGSEDYDSAVISQYSVLRPGTVGSSVYALQQRLKNLGYPIGDLTGVFDDQTARCVRMFYRAYGLAANDVANVAMQKELYADTARAYDPALEDDSATSSNRVLQPKNTSVIDETTALVLGSSGIKVSQVQQKLIALGYMADNGDTGVFDEATQLAVNRFLQAVGRSPEGLLTQDMQTFLLSDRAPALGEESETAEYENLNVGDSGDAVMALQRRLVELGYANGTPNGKYGNATISAVRLYQQANGLDEDGLASAWLQSMMFSDSALTYEETKRTFESLNPEPTPAPTEAARPGNDTLYFNLTLGATGAALDNLQARLVQLGYMDEASGVYDENTQKAVAHFQHAICVPLTGDASASLQRYIYSKAAPKPSVRFYKKTREDLKPLELGDEGDEVAALQRRLWELGFLDKDDIQDSVGAYNQATWRAVASAQLRMGYQSTDGNAGIEFQSFLYSKYGDKLKEED